MLLAPQTSLADGEGPHIHGSALPSGSDSTCMKTNVEELQVRRSNCSNTLQFVGLVLGQPDNRSKCQMAVDVVRPIEEAQAVNITQCKMRRGGFQLDLNQVCHAWIHECSHQSWSTQLNFQ